MKKACVIGYPISHSLSPVIHNYWLKKYGIEGSYEAVEVKPEELTDFLLNLKKNGYEGCNITVPHKEKAFEILKDLAGKNTSDNLPTEVAKMMGAINTVKVDDANNYTITNTDFIGFARNIISHQPEFDYPNSTPLILGAGGAAKAIAFALGAMHVQNVVLTNRTKDKAEELKKLMVEKLKFKEDRVIVIDWDLKEEVLPNINLLINTTSLGMKNQPPLDINISKIYPDSIVTDIVYNPLETKLLADAKAMGLKTIDGLGMLLHQAAPAFEGWFGVKPEVTTELRDAVLEKLKF
jgi:shikimate dehydrogenase